MVGLDRMPDLICAVMYLREDDHRQVRAHLGYEPARQVAPQPRPLDARRAQTRLAGRVYVVAGPVRQLLERMRSQGVDRVGCGPGACPDLAERDVVGRPLRHLEA